MPGTWYTRSPRRNNPPGADRGYGQQTMIGRIKYDPEHDYYDQLGVAPTASRAEVQRAFRERAKALHPDRHPPERQAWATGEFQRLNEAYAVLNDPHHREAYDRLRWPHARQRSAGSTSADPWWAQPHPRDSRSTGESSPPPSWSWPNKPPPGPVAVRPLHAVGRLFRGPYAALYFLLIATGVMGIVSITFLTNIVGVDLFVSRDDVARNMILPEPSCENPGATIQTPEDGATVPGTFDLVGSADVENFRLYFVDLAPAALDEDGRRVWVRLGPGVRSPVQDDTLWSVDLSILPPGEYVLRLAVQQDGGVYLPPCERLVVYAE